MSFSSACELLVLATLRNFVAHQVRRLRRPRYLIPAALGLLYFAWALASNPVAELTKRLPRSGDLARQVESIGALLLAAGAIATWLFGKPRPRLTFTEAEIHLLFAAPVVRRQIVHFRLIKLMLQSALVAAVMTVVIARSVPGAAGRFGVAAWLALSTLELHAVGASFARARMHAELAGVRLRAVQLGFVVLVASGLYWASFGESFAAGPRSWVLWPVRALIRPGLAHGASFLLALAPAVAVLVLHYIWVLIAADRFEDAAVEGAERAARRLEALRSGGAAALLASGRSRPAPFRLSRSATPEVALAWKGLIGMSRSLVLRMFAIAIPISVAGAVGVFLWASGTETSAPAVVGSFAAVVLFLLAVLGPTFTGGGVTGDLSRLDVLKTLPLSGARIVLGEVLAPTVVLTAIWLVCVPFASFLTPAHLDALERTCLALALALVGPPTLLLGVLLQASIVVLLPGWTTVAPGPLALGGRMLAWIAQLVGLPLLVLPAAITAAVLVNSGYPLVGWAAIPGAAALTALVLCGEIALFLLVVGRLFERLDPSQI